MQRPQHSTRPDTLVRRLTPPGEGGISLIELAGPDASTILGRLFSSPSGRGTSSMPAGKLLYGKMLRHGETLDEVILDCVQLQPEPVFIVNCHGGAVASERVVQTLLDEGAALCSAERRIEALRARGDVDAVRSEAEEAIPRAATITAAAHLLDQFEGALSAAILQARAAAVRGDWTCASRIVEQLLSTAAFGRGLLDPPMLVLAGRPNVGKSTLANTLLRYDRMIVHPLPGTTRDTVEELVNIGGLPFRLADTAGLRHSRDAVEREGVERARRALKEADAAVLIFDASEPLSEEDFRLLAATLPDRVVPVLNKCDLPRAAQVEAVSRRLDRQPVEISAARGEGIAELEADIVKAVWPARPARGEPVIFTERQERLLQTAHATASSRKATEFAAALDELVGRK